MGWSAIVEAIAARISAICPTATVNNRIRNIKSSLDTKDWGEAYKDWADSTVNCWQITRVGRREINTDDSSKKRTQHEIEIWHHRSVVDCSESEQLFQLELDQVVDDFSNGDRTLGGACVSLGTPAAEQIGHAMLAESVLCHSGSLKFTAEESVSAGTAETVVAIPSEFWRTIGDALIVWISPQLTSLALTAVKWDAGTTKAPPTPIDPRTECPRLLLRLADNDIELQPNHCQVETNSGALWLQLRQAKGDDHHKRLVAYAGTIAQKFLGEQRPAGLQSVGVEFMELTRVIYHDPVEHSLGDPTLRVSTAEIQFEIRARRYPA